MGTLQSMLGTEEWPIMMWTSIDCAFIPKTHNILLILCPESHRSDPCNLPLPTWGCFLGWFVVCGVGVFFILSPGRSIHNLRSVLYTEISSVFPFQSSAQLTPDANKCRHANAYFNDRAKPFNPEPSMAPLWTLPASSQLQKRFWLLVVSFFPPPGSRSSNACSHAHPLHYMGKTELSMADLNLPR